MIGPPEKCPNAKPASDNSSLIKLRDNPIQRDFFKLRFFPETAQMQTPTNVEDGNDLDSKQESRPKFHIWSLSLCCPLKTPDNDQGITCNANCGPDAGTAVICVCQPR